MNNYYWCEFVRGTLQSAGTRASLEVPYLLNLYKHNENSKEQKNIFAIESKFFAERLVYNLPQILTPENGINSDILIAGVKIAKKEELTIMLAYEYDEYIKTKEPWVKYHELQLKEATRYKENKKIDSPVLQEIANRKSIIVDELVKRIFDNARKHDLIIANRKFLLHDVAAEIDMKSLSELYDFEIINEIRKRLFE